MKKITVLFVAFAALALASCTSETGVAADETTVDSTTVEAAAPVAVDTVTVVDTAVVK